MGFRTMEVNCSAELHVQKGRLLIEYDEGKVAIALDDLDTLVLSGPDIRLSSNAMASMAEQGVMLIVCGRSYRPQGILMSTTPNARHTLVARQQISARREFYDELWASIIRRKIENQSRCLALLEKPGSTKLAAYVEHVNLGDKENIEGVAAREYFPLLHEGLNRRTDDPFNSILNYGYAIVRSKIVKAVVSTGFVTCIGIHHDSQLNTFNLADDLIEPYRPFVDIMASKLLSSSSRLDKEQRHALVGVLHHRCLIDGVSTSVMRAIERTVDSFRQAIENEDATRLQLPVLVQPEMLDEVDE